MIKRDYYQSVFGYRQYHVLGIKIVLCEYLGTIFENFSYKLKQLQQVYRFAH